MGNSNSTIIKKLQTAINNKGQKIVYQTSQFYSKQQDRPITMYYIKQAVWNEEKKRHKYIELFKSTSQIQIVLYLRDMWYELNNWPVPDNNDKWKQIKKEKQ